MLAVTQRSLIDFYTFIVYNAIYYFSLSKQSKRSVDFLYNPSINEKFFHRSLEPGSVWLTEIADILRDFENVVSKLDRLGFTSPAPR